jgi:broad specificity phosphatase PhoE
VISETGRQQAEAARYYLQHTAPTAIFSSPQGRARQTAEIIGQRHSQLALQISPLIDEVHSPFDGSPRRVLEARQWDLYSGVEPGYEQPAHIVERVQRFLAGVRHQYRNQHSLAVTHGDIIVFTLLWAGGLEPAVGHKGRLASLGVTDGYPAQASISSLIYVTDAPDERPAFDYVRPYGGEVLW